MNIFFCHFFVISRKFFFIYLFNQVDLEMSFVNSEGIMSLIEDLISSTLAQTVPHLKVTPPPFPRMNYKTAMEKVGDQRCESKL